MRPFVPTRIARQSHCMMIAWAVLFGIGAPAMAGDGLKRWAIVASAEVRKSGIADLLVAEATEDSEFELVEREELTRIADELAVAALGALDGSGQRLKVGRLLHADALILLSPAQNGNGTLRVVICECRNGVRLADFECGKNADSPQQTAQALVAEMKRVRGQFKDGIRLIIGVAPFLSQNPGHEYDHLQSRYGDLLSRSLALQAGVAVIEVREARAILKERSLAAMKAIDRTVPLIVNARFRMTRPNASAAPTVELTIDLVTGSSSRRLPTQPIPLAQAPEWIMVKLAGQLLDAAGAKFTPLTNEQERQTLIRQADAFSRLGDWPRAVGLREAALVVQPADAEQRARLIDEYQQRFVRDFQQIWFPKKLPNTERARLLEQCADYFVTALDHLEYLIRNPLISRDEAIVTFRRQKWEGPGAMFKQVAVDALPANERPAIERVLDAERRFVVDVFAKTLALPTKAALPGVIVPPQVSELWWDTLLWRVVNHVECRKLDRQSLDYLADVLIRVMPKDTPTTFTMRLLLQQTTMALDERYRDSWTPDKVKLAESWPAFLQKLARSDNATARLYGRLGLLERSCFKVRSRSVTDRAAILEVVKEVDDIFYEIVSRRPQSDDVFHSLDVARRWLLAHIDPALNPDSPKGLPATVSLGRLRFHPRELMVSGETESATNAKSPLLFRNMLDCGGKLDVYWTDKTLYLMERKGVLRPLPLTGHPQWSKYSSFSHVTWDGECIWLIVAGRGIYVLAADGMHLTTFDKSLPMPGFEKGLQMLPLAPRRMLAVGSFGDHHRAWCGILEVSAANKPTVRVFHEAKRVADGRPAEEANANLETAFQPTWIHRFHGRDGLATALVGRDRRAEALAIDLETFALSIVSYQTRGYGSNEAFFSRKGHLLQVTGPAVYHFSPHTTGQGPAPVETLFPHTSLYRQVLPFEGWVHVPGWEWRRIREDTFEIERLQPEKALLPQWNREMRFGVSAHYGLIGYKQYVPLAKTGSPVFYQITIAGETK